MKILIVEDHKLTNECLRIGLQKFEGFEICAQAFDGQAAVELAAQHQPDVVLMDICMPVKNGVQATADIKQANPEIKIIMTTSLVQKDAVKAAFAAKADAYYTKGTDLDQLAQVIQAVYGGSTCIDPSVARFMMEEMSATRVSLNAPETVGVSRPSSVLATSVKSESLQSESVDKVFEQKPQTWRQYSSSPDEPAQVGQVSGSVEENLTPRELQILKLIAENNTNEQIAAKAKLSDAWLTGYIKNILVKLSADNEVQAVRRALDEGVISEAPLLESA